jgi:histidine triad (HIT) family protein
MSQDCVFCKIASGQIKSEMVYRDDRCFAIRDIHPRAPVHLLVMPLQHVTDLSKVTPGLEPLMGHLFLAAHEAARKEGIADRGYRCIINQGRDGGQEVPHVHMHVLGGRRLGRMVPED